MDNKRSISEKYSLDYYRHSLPTRAWKSRWNYFALLLALLAFGGMYFFGRNTTFQAAPVASVHSSFGTDCGRCHEQAWGAGQRLVSGSNHSFSVSDTACKQCHPAGPHAAILKAEPMCAECHQEHRPGKRLTEVANNACIRCHSNLVLAIGQEQENEKNAKEKDLSFFPEISQFKSGHPEFALKRTSQDKLRDRHAARLVAEFDEKEGATKDTWVDRGGVKFNHQKHLDSKYVWEPDSPDRKPLTCNNCHVSRSDGYMEPIKYDAHCRRCHNLKLGGEFADLGDLPHRQLEEVRGVIRERAAKKFANAAPKKDPESKTQFLRLPRPARLTEDQEHKLSDLTTRAEQALLRTTPKDERSSTCARCHYFGKHNGDWQVETQNPAFAVDLKNLHLPNTTKVEAVPSRWMRHAIFNHNNHWAIACAECHHDVDKRKDTTDIMLPSIDDCRRCHGANEQTASPHISADCVLCHIYHKQPADKGFHGKPLEELFSNGSKKAAGGAAK